MTYGKHAQLRRVLAVFLLLGIISMSVVASGLILQVVQVPTSIIPTLTSLQDPNPCLQVPNRGLVTVYQNVNPAAIRVGDAVYAKNGVNIRKRPNGAIVRRAKARERLELLGRERTWNKVRLPDGTEAFIHESVVTASDTTLY